MNEGALTGGRITMAVLLSLAVTGLSLAILTTALLIAADATSGSRIYAGEAISSLLYLIILAVALTFAFGAVPFAVVTLLLVRFRAVSALAFALGGAFAGIVAAVACIFVLTNSVAAAMDEIQKLAFEDFTGLAVVLASVFGGFAAWRYLDRAARTATV